jgi:hypothetical protein
LAARAAALGCVLAGVIWVIEDCNFSFTAEYFMLFVLPVLTGLLVGASLVRAPFTPWRVCVWIMVAVATGFAAFVVVLGVGYDGCP